MNMTEEQLDLYQRGALPQRSKRGVVKAAPQYKTPESKVVAACMGWLRIHGIKAIRNNSGAIKTESGAWVRFGDKGSPDILCRVPVACCGRKFATLVGVECKSSKGLLSDDQKAWRAAHEEDGGLYIVSRGIDDLQRGLRDVI